MIKSSDFDHDRRRSGAGNRNSIIAGARGPAPLQDCQLVGKLAHRNRERGPERMVHAEGRGA